jgi:hypothetical protein
LRAEVFLRVKLCLAVHTDMEERRWLRATLHYPEVMTPPDTMTVMLMKPGLEHGHAFRTWTFGKDYDFCHDYLP